MKPLRRAALTPALLLMCASCGSADAPPAETGLSKGESDALDNAAEMLDAAEENSRTNLMDSQ